MSPSVELLSWRHKISEDQQYAAAAETVPESERVEMTPDTSYHEHELYRGGVLTLGCCGYPNVGKSSVINALIGRKVSVWRVTVRSG